MKKTNPTTTLYAGGAAVLVEYEYEAGEDPIYDLNSPMCGPGCAACVTLVSALVNGEWVDPDEVFNASVLALWIDKIAEEEVEAIESARDEYECSRWEQQQEALAERGWP